ncbi:unannotated protein [freshwater metagenome]|uniref:Unannotated protein n=1 Tax=freshwater metagenome TaxID=449393 RepID=A0A6J6UUN8_9ZZZZ
MALPSAAMSVPVFSAIRSPRDAVSVTLHGRATDADATSVAGNRSVRESGSGNHRRDESGSVGAGIAAGAAKDWKSQVIFEPSGREIESLAASGASQGAFSDPNHSHVPFFAGNARTRQSRARVMLTYRRRLASSIASARKRTPSGDWAITSAISTFFWAPKGHGQ